MHAIAVAVALGLAAQSVYDTPLPELKGRVNDLAGLLGGERAGALEARLERYEQETGHQFALLTIDTLNGRPLEEYSIKLAEKWKLGDAKRDDGLIFLVVKNDRKLRIEVGYGLEGAIPDIVAKRVLDQYVTPHFRAGDFAGGIELAFEQLMKAAAGEALGPPPPSRGSGPKPNSPAGGAALAGFLLVCFIVFFLMALRYILFPLAGGFIGYMYAGWFGAVVGAIIGLVLVFAPGSKGGPRGGGRRRSGFGTVFGGFSSGGSSGGSFGGFSGGGFSGGGGGFGGGGASGGW